MASDCDGGLTVNSQDVKGHSRAAIASIEKVPRWGNPDESKISTSYVERFALSARMHVRRDTRLTDAHSKSLEHDTPTTAIAVAFYNFCHKHQSCGKGNSDVDDDGREGTLEKQGGLSFTR
jgi:hypothetical protein